jgi:hypothetical protein
MEIGCMDLNMVVLNWISLIWIDLNTSWFDFASVLIKA